MIKNQRGSKTYPNSQKGLVDGSLEKMLTLGAVALTAGAIALSSCNSNASKTPQVVENKPAIEQRTAESIDEFVLPSNSSINSSFNTTSITNNTSAANNTATHTPSLSGSDYMALNREAAGYDAQIHIRSNNASVIAKELAKTQKLLDRHQDKFGDGIADLRQDYAKLEVKLAEEKRDYETDLVRAENKFDAKVAKETARYDAKVLRAEHDYNNEVRRAKLKSLESGFDIAAIAIKMYNRDDSSIKSSDIKRIARPVEKSYAAWQEVQEEREEWIEEQSKSFNVQKKHIAKDYLEVQAKLDSVEAQIKAYDAQNHTPVSNATHAVSVLKQDQQMNTQMLQAITAQRSEVVNKLGTQYHPSRFTQDKRAAMQAHAGDVYKAK